MKTCQSKFLFTDFPSDNPEETIILIIFVVLSAFFIIDSALDMLTTGYFGLERKFLKFTFLVVVHQIAAFYFIYFFPMEPYYSYRWFFFFFHTYLYFAAYLEYYMFCKKYYDFLPEEDLIRFYRFTSIFKIIIFVWVLTLVFLNIAVF